MDISAKLHLYNILQIPVVPKKLRVRVNLGGLEPNTAMPTYSSKGYVEAEMSPGDILESAGEVIQGESNILESNRAIYFSSKHVCIVFYLENLYELVRKSELVVIEW